MLRSRHNPTEEVLYLLGAERRPWRRRWVPEKQLVDELRDRDLVIEVLDVLERDPDVRVSLHMSNGERYWFLEQGPRGNRTKVGDEVHSDAPPRPRKPVVHDPDEPAGVAALETTAESQILSTDLPGDPTGDVVVDHVALDETQRLRVAMRELGFSDVRIGSTPHVGPNVTRYRVYLPVGARVGLLRHRAEDIARWIGSPGDVIVSNLPAEGCVAVDVPRTERSVVPLKLAIKALLAMDRSGLFFAVGVTPDGRQVNLDLGLLPHLLVAGTPGAGKTVFLLCLLLCLAFRFKPDELEIIVVDLKGVDFACVAALPHLQSRPVIADCDGAIEILSHLVEQELPARTGLLQETGCMNLRELRRRYPERGVRHTVLVIDEYAELVASLPRPERLELEQLVLRFAQRGRAAGLHLVIATQRPSTDIITGPIKANLPCRIAFRLPQRVDSMAILDQPGAESLLGLGDMLLLHQARLERLQGFFATSDEIAELVAKRRDD